MFDAKSNLTPHTYAMLKHSLPKLKQMLQSLLLICYIPNISEMQVINDYHIRCMKRYRSCIYELLIIVNNSESRLYYLFTMAMNLQMHNFIDI